MILHFSGTGNSKHLATLIAEATGERLLDMAALMDKGTTFICLEKDEMLGWVFPVHFWGLPALVRDFIGSLYIRGYSGQYTFAAATFGMLCGNPHGQMRSLLRQKGIALNAAFSVRMVDVWTPIFNLSDTARCLRITQDAIPHMQRIAAMIADRKCGNFVRRPLPALVDGLHWLLYQNRRPTAPFHLADGCIGCGQCASNCPTKAIAMHAGRPQWTKAQCTLCLRCLHHCPAFAIQYGRFTHHHGQFANPFV